MDMPNAATRAISDGEAEEAVRSLLRLIGENPDREGLIETPARVVRAFKEYFSGYSTDPAAYLAKTFEETSGYDEIVALTHIPFYSHCEHHLAPFFGVVHVGYLPRERVVGISKLARLVDVFAKRAQIQERMTVEIGKTVQDVLNPRGVAVVIEATHTCVTSRGIRKAGSTLKTSHMLGHFRGNVAARREFFDLVHQDRAQQGR